MWHGSRRRSGCRGAASYSNTTHSDCARPGALRAAVMSDVLPEFSMLTKSLTSPGCSITMAEL